MLSRTSAARQLFRTLVAGTGRTYVTDIGRSAGSVATAPTGFDKREKANEDQFIRRHEMELRAKLRKQIESRKAEIEELKKQEEEISEMAEGRKE